MHGFVLGFSGSKTPITENGRIVSLFARDTRRAAGPVSYDEYFPLKGQLKALDWVGAARISQASVRLSRGSTVLSIAALTPELARLLELPVEQGAVISHRLWKDDFGGKKEQIHVGATEFAVAGVAPDWLEGLYRDRAVDIWIPLREESLQARDRSNRNFWMLGALREGAAANQIVRDATETSSEIYMVPYSGMTPEMTESLGRVGTLLRAASGFVFFIACTNVALFLLARATARSQETSLRVALGANVEQLARALLSDSLVISVAGGVPGMVLAMWTARIVPALLFEQDAEHLVFSPDPLRIVEACAVCIAIMVMCGLVPLLQTPQRRPAAVLRRESAGPSKIIRVIRASLVTAQMACCCVLVITTGFLIESLDAAIATTVAQRIGQPVLAAVSGTPMAGYQYFTAIQKTAESMNGFSTMAWAARLPGSDPSWRSFRIEPPGLPPRKVVLDVKDFNADSLALFRLPPSAGRLFGLIDTSCPTAVVNEEAAGMLFGSETVGRSVTAPSGLPVEIIGVVAMRRPGRPAIYFQTGGSGMQTAPFQAPEAAELKRAELDWNIVSPEYFDAIGLKAVAGRIFGKSTACRVAVVNQEAADLYFGGSGVGNVVIDDFGQRTEITGVVRSAPLGTFQRRVEPVIYFPMLQDYPLRITLILRAGKVNDQILRELLRRLEAVQGRGEHPPGVKTLEKHLKQTALAPLRIATMILGASAATALLLSILGLYGTLNDAARQRGRELAVRIALGARRWNIISLVLREGAKLAIAGAVAGLAISVLLLRFLPDILPSHGSPGVLVWLAGPLVLASAVIVSSVFPARRALMADPLRMMREN